MAEGEGRTLVEAFDAYAERKSAEVIEEQEVNSKTFQQGMRIRGLASGRDPGEDPPTTSG